MHIVVLDACTLNPGDLSWEALTSLGACTIYEHTLPEQRIERIQQAEIVLTNKVPLDDRTLAQLPKLRYIGVLATGYNVVDTHAAAQLGVPVTNIPEYGTRSVAQMTMALLLELCHHVGHHARTVQEGRWVASRDFCYWDTPLYELDGLTMGLAGLGRIGQAVARLSLAFGMHVQAFDPVLDASPLPEVALCDLETLFGTSDVLSLHCPLTPENTGLVNAERLSWMRPSAFLLNTARGPLIDEMALASALHEGKIAGAALDVLSVEPPTAENPLLGAPRCLITPHIAWATHAARARLLATAVDNVVSFLQGAPRNVVNAPLLLTGRGVPVRDDREG